MLTGRPLYFSGFVALAPAMPSACRDFAMFSLETSRVLDAPGSTFDPSRYDGMVQEIFRN